MCYNTPIATPTLKEQIMEATYILTIGLNTTDGAITIEEARETLRAYGFSILRESLLEYDTEPTLVAGVAAGFATTTAPSCSCCTRWPKRSSRTASPSTAS